jgi:hypothetical protein
MGILRVGQVHSWKGLLSFQGNNWDGLFFFQVNSWDWLFSLEVHGWDGSDIYIYVAEIPLLFRLHCYAPSEESIKCILILSSL